MIAKPPRAGRSPHRRMFAHAPTPRPCGEMTSGIGGCFNGPYQAGRIRYARREKPSWARYEIGSTRTASTGGGVKPADGNTAGAAHRTTAMIGPRLGAPI